MSDSMNLLCLQLNSIEFRLIHMFFSYLQRSRRLAWRGLLQRKKKKRTYGVIYRWANLLKTLRAERS